MFASANVDLLAALGHLGSYVTGILRTALFNPGSSFSLASLLTALLVALLFLGYRHRNRKRPLPLRVLIRAIFPKRIIASRTSKADVGFFFFNTFIATAMLGWALLSSHVIAGAVTGGLTAAFGAMDATSLPTWACVAILTIVAFVAYEFGFFLAHYLLHKVPFLWEFHTVHHQAEALSPLTNYRLHPVDSVMFVNFTALAMGTASGVLVYLFGKPIEPFAPWSVNAVVLVLTYLLDHLHHTEFWIPFTGIWGKILVSPAHHQIHHSLNPAHYDKNMGSCLAVFDWMFGTLFMPGKEPEKLKFGVTPTAADPHSISECLVNPFVRAAAHAGLKVPTSESPSEATPTDPAPKVT